MLRCESIQQLKCLSLPIENITIQLKKSSSSEQSHLALMHYGSTNWRINSEKNRKRQLLPLILTRPDTSQYQSCYWAGAVMPKTYKTSNALGDRKTDRPTDNSTRQLYKRVCPSVGRLVHNAFSHTHAQLWPIRGIFGYCMGHVIFYEPLVMINPILI